MSDEAITPSTATAVSEASAAVTTDPPTEATPAEPVVPAVSTTTETDDNNNEGGGGDDDAAPAEEEENTTANFAPVVRLLFCFVLDILAYNDFSHLIVLPSTLYLHFRMGMMILNNYIL